MKLKEGFVFTEVGDACVAVPTGEQDIVTPYDETKDVLFCAPPLCE